jgi:hypothetical protein
VSRIVKALERFMDEAASSWLDRSREKRLRQETRELHRELEEHVRPILAPGCWHDLGTRGYCGACPVNHLNSTGPTRRVSKILCSRARRVSK